MDNENKSCGICHVVIKDVEFLIDQDYQKFITAMDTLQKTMPDDNGADHICCHFYAYCLLPGCAHLLMREKDWNVAKCVEFLLNAMEDDITPDYLVEPCDNPERFLELFAFIHQIPKKEGMCEMMRDYEWSSWGNEYLRLGAECVCRVSAVVRRFGFGKLIDVVGTPLPETVDVLDYVPCC